MNEVKNNDLLFAKVRPDAIIPTKERENKGYDVYACFEEDYMAIPAHTTVLIPTGIASAMTPEYGIRLRDRGSNGSKGIHVNCGSIDSGFRSEWFVAWCNTNDRDVVLSKLTKEELYNKHGQKPRGYILEGNEVVIPYEVNKLIADENDNYEKDFLWLDLGDEKWNPIIYPYSKAICQAEVEKVYEMNEQEIPYEDLIKIPSKRGMGSLGSSGK